MSWYDPTSWDFSTDADRENQSRAGKLDQQAAAAAQFGQQAADNYNTNNYGYGDASNYLSSILAGKNSVSAEMLRQGMQQGVAAQQAMAASASPQNAAMAARTAMNNMGRLGYGLSGQETLADLQARQAAAAQLGQLALGARGQDLQGFLGANSNAMSGYGAQMPQSAGTQMLMSGVGGFAQGAGMAVGKSDRRLKTDIEPGDAVAGKAVGGLKAQMFRYKSEAAGAPKRLGVMAQDLEKTPGLSHVVIDTPRGKMIHGGHLSTANTAMIAHLAKRVGDLEAKRGGDPPRTASMRKDVGKLDAADRKRIPKSEMGLPGKAEKGKGAVSGSYPMPDRKHAGLAKAMASRYASPSERAKIDAKANKILAR
jgi:hypothetical protein